MNLSDLIRVLSADAAAALRIVLPSGRTAPDEFHVTEVGHVTKRFVDCGGALRETEACVLQVWVAANDADHRLTAGKLRKIIALAEPVLPSQNLSVEIEYEDGVLSQYPVLDATPADGVVTLRLGSKHTDCLAKDACGLSPVRIGAPVVSSGCGCGPKGCC